MTTPLPITLATLALTAGTTGWDDEIKGDLVKLRDRALAHETTLLTIYDTNTANLQATGIVLRDSDSLRWLVRPDGQQGLSLTGLDGGNPDDPPPVDGDPSEVLLHKTPTSDVAISSTEPGNPPANMTDGNTATRFISLPISPINIDVDMGAVYTLSQVKIVWAANTIKNYLLKISTDGTTFTTFFTGVTDNTQSQTRTYIAGGGTADSFSATAKGRYFRITATDRWNTAYGNSIYELSAQGVIDDTAPVGSIVNFTGTVDSNTQITLAWDAYSGSALTSYTLKQSINGATATTITAPTVGSTSKVITGLTAGNTYTYTLVGNYTAGGTTNTVSVTKTTTGGTVVHDWWSGASGVGVADKTFGTWRGNPCEVMTTWPSISGVLPTLDVEYLNWDQNGILMTGLVDRTKGQTWGAAAAGAYDTTWRNWLITAKQKWQRIQRGKAIIGLNYEMNATWMPWSVTAADVGNHSTAVTRFRSFHLELFPESLCGINPIGQTNAQSYDWRGLLPKTTAISGLTAFGTRGRMDHIGVNWYASVYKTAGLTTGALLDGYGAPHGLESHRAHAAAIGVPLIIPEWGCSNPPPAAYGTGDDATYIQSMFNFFSTNGALLPSNWQSVGTGAIAGKVLAETYFNVQNSSYPNSQFQLYPQTNKPLAAARYQSIF